MNAEDFIGSGDNQFQDIDYTEIKKEQADASNYLITPKPLRFLIFVIK